MEKIDTYQKYLSFLDKDIIKKPKLLLHCCCAPCSSSVLEQLEKRFEITLYYYNPNTYPESEYDKRFIQFNKLNPYPIIKEEYHHQDFLDIVKGLEEMKEGTIRCFKCYEMRLEQTAKKAKELNFDFFSTTLSVSPHKNSKIINELGEKYSNKYLVNFLYSDFKKRDGYKESIILSKKYNLYRQDYCGCEFSLQERNKKENIK